MKKSYWVVGAMLLLGAIGAMAMAAAPNEYWIGIGCSSVAPLLQSQLNLPDKQGVVVEEVAPDSPAAKAGILQHDVLLRAGEKVLTDPRDLVEIIDATKDGVLKVELLRGGKPTTIEVTPAIRPEEARRPALPGPAPGDREAMEQWMQQMWRGESGAVGQRPHAQFRIFHPGAIVPHDAIAAIPLPPNTSVTLSKEGDQPVKIVVKRGEEKWEVTEKELDKLPADIRPYIEQILGRGPLGIVDGLRAFDFGPDAAGDRGMLEDEDDAAEGPRPPHGHGLLEQMEKRFDAMDRRMEKLMKQMDEFIGGHPTVGAPQEHHE